MRITTWRNYWPSEEAVKQGALDSDEMFESFGIKVRRSWRGNSRAALAGIFLSTGYSWRIPKQNAQRSEATSLTGTSSDPKGMIDKAEAGKWTVKRIVEEIDKKRVGD
ncbi:MAG: hypothetical protein ACYC0V_00160 [Armatimonadota bacterium]